MGADRDRLLLSGDLHVDTLSRHIEHAVEGLCVLVPAVGSEIDPVTDLVAGLFAVSNDVGVASAFTNG